VRPADAGDVPALAAILAANDEPMDWPDLPGLGWPYLEHLVGRARTAVAVVDDGRADGPNRNGAPGLPAAPRSVRARGTP
jgi:hypothetical protein